MSINFSLAKAEQTRIGQTRIGLSRARPRTPGDSHDTDRICFGRPARRSHHCTDAGAAGGVQGQGRSASDDRGSEEVPEKWHEQDSDAGRHFECVWFGQQAVCT